VSESTDNRGSRAQNHPQMQKAADQMRWELADLVEVYLIVFGKLEHYDEAHHSSVTTTVEMTERIEYRGGKRDSIWTLEIYGSSAGTDAEATLRRLYNGMPHYFEKNGDVWTIDHTSFDSEPECYTKADLSKLLHELRPPADAVAEPPADDASLTEELARIVRQSSLLSGQDTGALAELAATVLTALARVGDAPASDALIALVYQVGVGWKGLGMTQAQLRQMHELTRFLQNLATDPAQSQ
jgi:hypothetical protein